MSSTPRYAHGATRPFGDVVGAPFDDAAAVILPAPLERTTSYVQGTRQGPAAILQASAQLELWDEELGVEVHSRGLCTLPEMALPFDALADALAEIQRVADGVVRANKFLVTLGGEHSITPPLVAATAAHHDGLCVLQIDAHADLRDEYLGDRNSHACAIRRALDYAPCTQVGIRSLSTEEAGVVESLPTTIFYDTKMRAHSTWMHDVVETLHEKVYITIDCDGLDPAVMPAVGTPEPGGLGWRELLALLRLTFQNREVVGCDVVELCPVPGLVHPNFLCAKLVYKLLTYRLAGG